MYANSDFLGSALMMELWQCGTQGPHLLLLLTTGGLRFGVITYEQLNIPRVFLYVSY